ncbi:hypothetical protein BJ742DRAFT_572460 [Cladochytrium replicatum]|nr:hypothetical protein BJ742DRAFT_572460 [Cladochytrium replicatum]
MLGIILLETSFDMINDKTFDDSSPEGEYSNIHDEFEYIFSEYQTTACSSPSLNDADMYSERADDSTLGTLTTGVIIESESSASSETHTIGAIYNQGDSQCDDDLGHHDHRKAPAHDDGSEDAKVSALDDGGEREKASSSFTHAFDDLTRGNFSQYAIDPSAEKVEMKQDVRNEGLAGDADDAVDVVVDFAAQSIVTLNTTVTAHPIVISPIKIVPSLGHKNVCTILETQSPTLSKDQSRSVRLTAPRRPTSNPFSPNYVRKSSARKVSSNRKVSNSSIVKLLQEDPTAVEEVSALLDELLSHRGSPRRGVKALKSFWESTTAAANMGSRRSENRPRASSIWGLRQRKQPCKPSGTKAVVVEKRESMYVAPSKALVSVTNEGNYQTIAREEKESSSEVHTTIVNPSQTEGRAVDADIKQQMVEVAALSTPHREQGGESVDSLATNRVVEESIQGDAGFVEFDRGELESQKPIQLFFRSPRSTAHATTIAASTARSTSLAVLAIEEEITHIETIPELNENNPIDAYEFVWPQSQCEETVEEVVVVVTKSDDTHKHEEEHSTSQIQKNARRKGKGAYGPMTIDAFGNLIRKNRAIKTFGPDGIHAYADDEDVPQEPNPSTAVKRSSTFFKFFRSGRLWRRATPLQPHEEVLFRDPDEEESPKDNVSLTTTTSTQPTLVDTDGAAFETKQSRGWWDAMKRRMRGQIATERSVFAEA